LFVEIRICWRRSGRRDVGDVGFGGWSHWRDVAACTWRRRLRTWSNPRWTTSLCNCDIFLN
jgi:hypothetical protein